LFFVSSVIEAEVRYAVRHEYAQTAIDVLARRCRLAFLNAQAAYDALPRVVDIMTEELGWNKKRKKQETDAAVAFLQRSMGLNVSGAGGASETSGWIEWAKAKGGFVFGWTPKAEIVPRAYTYSRALFEAGEVESLRRAFEAHVSSSESTRTSIGTESPSQASAQSNSPSGTSGSTLMSNNGGTRLNIDTIWEALREVPGYERTTEKALLYVLDEAGLARHLDVDFDEFVEVGNFLSRPGLLFSIVANKRSSPSPFASSLEIL
jgi:glycerol-3-phosphate dehydrogenase